MNSSTSFDKTIGRYEIIRPIGKGAMGRVLLAHDPVLDRDVAIKILRDDLRIPPEVQDGLIVRMRHEARAAARVSHPNLVTLYDMGEDAQVGLFLVFEYVSGPTLKQRLVDGRLLPSQAARLAQELGSALGFAHAAGILHRDVKPENVMLSLTGGKLTDFGIARIPDSTLTHAGGLLGTPAYSAPETFRAGKFSAESDQFSLAATLYEAVYGKRAFPGDDAVAVASKIANDEPDRLAVAAGLRASVDHVFSRALAKDPADRYPSCEAFGNALAAELDPIRAELVTLPDLASSARMADIPPQPRSAGRVALGAAVLAVTAAFAVRAMTRPTDNVETTPTAEASASVSSEARAPATSRPRPVVKPKPRPTTENLGATAQGEGGAGPAASGTSTPQLTSTVDGSASAGPPPVIASASASAGAAPSAPPSPTTASPAAPPTKR